jgi:DNA-binding MarR family transcriptional regulator
MSTQLLTDQGTLEVTAWVRLLRSYSALTRRLNGELLENHGLHLNEYEVLLVLSQQEEGMRRVDLADAMRLTQSGITRLLEGLQKQGYVTRRACKTDARVSYAALTKPGRTKLERASETHLGAIRETFTDRYSEAELGQLAELLSRLPGGDVSDPRSCEPG